MTCFSSSSLASSADFMPTRSGTEYSSKEADNMSSNAKCLFCNLAIATSDSEVLECG